METKIWLPLAEIGGFCKACRMEKGVTTNQWDGQSWWRGVGMQSTVCSVSWKPQNWWMYLIFWCFPIWSTGWLNWYGKLVPDSWWKALYYYLLRTSLQSFYRWKSFPTWWSRRSVSAWLPWWLCSSRNCGEHWKKWGIVSGGCPLDSLRPQEMQPSGGRQLKRFAMPAWNCLQLPPVHWLLSNGRHV